METEAVKSIAKGIRRGSRRSFSLFYEEYKGYLYACILRFLNGNESDVRDVMQIVLVKLTRANVRWKTEAQLRSWCYIACRNASIDFLRKQRKLACFSGELVEVSENKARDRVVFELLEKGLSCLKSRDERLVRNVYFSGLSRREIAVNEGISMKALESKIARIRKKLKTFMEESDE